MASAQSVEPYSHEIATFIEYDVFRELLLARPLPRGGETQVVLGDAIEDVAGFDLNIEDSRC
jgi:hypothetical protein